MEDERLKDLVAQVVERRRGNWSKRSNNRDSRLSAEDARREELESAICLLHEQLEFAKKQRALREAAMKEKQASASANNYSKANAQIEAYMKRKNGPLNRLTITSDIYHQKNPHIAKDLFGYKDPRKGKDLQNGQKRLSSWEFTKQLIRVNFGLEHKEPTLENTRHMDGRSKELSPFEEAILTLYRKHNNHEHDFLAIMFGVDRKQIDRSIKRWGPLCDKLKGLEAIDMVQPTNASD